MDEISHAWKRLTSFALHVHFCPQTNYTIGDTTTNQCPTGSIALASQADCEVAASSWGVSLGVAGTYAGWPKDCFQYRNGNYYFNQHSTGSGHADARPVCKAVATTTTTTTTTTNIAKVRCQWGPETTGSIAGHNVTSYSGKTLAECKAACDANTLCKSIDFCFLDGACHLGDCQIGRGCDNNNDLAYYNYACETQAHWVVGDASTNQCPTGSLASPRTSD